jgi:periplasmic protein TonB
MTLPPAATPTVNAMNTAAPRLETVAAPAVTAERAIGLVLGIGFTFGLFWAMSHVDHQGTETEQPQFEEIYMATLAPPPPPPTVNHESTAPPAPVFVMAPGFAAEATGSPVRIVARPPRLDSLVEETRVPPPAAVRVDGLLEAFKPRLDLGGEPSHIYQRDEVDQRPKVIKRVVPNVTRKLVEDLKRPRTRFLVVVNTDGTASNIRIIEASSSPELDERALEALRQWTFSPGIRKGRPVRTLIEQSIYVRWTGGSRFSAD